MQDVARTTRLTIITDTLTYTQTARDHTHKRRTSYWCRLSEM